MAMETLSAVPGQGDTMTERTHRLLDQIVDESGCAPVLAADLHRAIETLQNQVSEREREERKRANEAEQRAERAEKTMLKLWIAGRALSNCAYNLSQRSHLTDREKKSLDEARRTWDEAWRRHNRGE